MSHDRRPGGGTYILALYLPTDRTVRVGRLGTFGFPAGRYLYVGSAHGPGGLVARLARHRRHGGRAKRLRWHIDYLRQAARWDGAWVRDGAERLECVWAARLHDLPGAQIVVPDFGASDCRCPAHLVRLPALPNDAWFAKHLAARRVEVEGRKLDDLLDILTTADEEAREEAAVALAPWGEEAVAALTALLASADADARWWAARALAEVGGTGAVQALIGALGDADPDVRACAALALGRIGDGAAALALARCLDDESSFVSGVAADALSMIGKAALPALNEALGYERPIARLLAVQALARIGSEEAIGPLLALLEDPSYLVRRQAEEALDSLGAGLILFAP